MIEKPWAFEVGKENGRTEEKKTWWMPWKKETEGMDINASVSFHVHSFSTFLDGLAGRGELRQTIKCCECEKDCDDVASWEGWKIWVDVGPWMAKRFIKRN